MRSLGPDGPDLGIDTLHAVSIERLATERNLWLATVRSDGRPHVAPVWFVYVDDRIWIGTGRTSVRVRNLREHPEASAALEDGAAPVVAEGTVLLHDEHRPPPVVEVSLLGTWVTVDVAGHG